MSRMRTVGTSPTKEDALAKAAGETGYGDDFHRPGEIYARVVRPRRVPARIRRIDPRPALALGGVRCVLTAADLPGVNQGRYPHFPVLAEETVRGVADAVALVAADTPELAGEAARRVRIDYEPLPGAYDAAAPGGRVLCDWKTEKGDVEEGFRRADVIVENTYSSACLDHAALEPEGGVAWLDECGVMNVRVPTQTIENYQHVARILGFPAGRVRYLCPMIGGAFGGKEHPQLGAFLALLALKTGRPVRMAYSREETMNSGSKKHPFWMRCRTGATRDGRLTAVEVDLVADAGAYPTNSGGLVLGALCISGGPYEIPNARGRARAVETNNPFTEAMRGVGANQVCFAYESQMDEVARRLGMDPLELRRRNFLRKGGTLMQGQPAPSEVLLPELLSRVRAAVGRTAGPVPEERRGPWRRGVGYAANLAGYGRPRNDGEAYLALQADGSASVRAGASDVGAGQTQILRQIAAEALGFPLERISAVLSDSEVTPLAGITAGSRQTLISGGALQRAGAELRGRLLRGAAELLEAAPEDLEIEDGEILVRGAAGRAVKVTEAIRRMKAMDLPLHATGRVRLGVHEYEGAEQYGDRGGWMDYTYGVHAAEVEVNAETGEIRLLRYWASHDVGQAVNPQNVEGQFEGGGMMGIGHALCEEIIPEKGGLLTEEFHSYLIPTSMETPGWASLILESGTGMGPYGAKGVGEPPCTAAAAAVANAVSQAVGARVTRIPITPEHVLEVMGKLGRGEAQLNSLTISGLVTRLAS